MTEAFISGILNMSITTITQNSYECCQFIKCTLFSAKQLLTKPEGKYKALTDGQTYSQTETHTHTHRVRERKKRDTKNLYFLKTVLSVTVMKLPSINCYVILDMVKIYCKEHIHS